MATIEQLIKSIRSGETRSDAAHEDDVAGILKCHTSNGQHVLPNGHRYEIGTLFTDLNFALAAIPEGFWLESLSIGADGLAAASLNNGKIEARSRVERSCCVAIVIAILDAIRQMQPTKEEAFKAAEDILSTYNDLEDAKKAPAVVARYLLSLPHLNAASSDVLNERVRQIEEEGHSTDSDDEYEDNELSRAAAALINYGNALSAYPEGYPPNDWPWPALWWKPRDARRNLVRAGALILAEIERLDRRDGR